MLILIASVDKNYGIGKDGGLLFPIKADLRRFKELTTGHTVVMGRKTLLSLPNGMPLKNRSNIVLSRNPEFELEGALVCRSKEEFFAAAGERELVFVIGGASVYKELLPYCAKALLTEIDCEFEADRFLPNISKMENWRLENRSEPLEHEGIFFRYAEYINLEPLDFEQI